MKIITSTIAEKKLEEIIKQVVLENQPVEISNIKNNESVIMISKSDWKSLQETLYLQNKGVLERIKHYENEETEPLGKVSWDTVLK